MDASASSGQIAAYSWSFGDGATGSGETTSHIYPHAGTYTVQLTVANASGSSSITHQVTVPANASTTTTSAGRSGTMVIGKAADAATLTWTARSFSAPVTVAVAPGPVGRASLALQLTVTSSTGAPVTHFAAPLEFTFPPDASGDVPAYSINGTTWTSMPQLAGTTLPDGYKDGWYRDAKGAIHVLTLHATYFGLLASPSNAKPELIAKVSVSTPAGSTLHVRVGATLPGSASIVLRAGSHVLARSSGAVGTRARHDFLLLLPARPPRQGALTVEVRAGGLLATKTLGVRLRRTPRR
jgi:hypothetical protein